MKSNLERIAEALEKQCEQNEQIISMWKSNIGIAEKNNAVNQRHLDMAEERYQLEMLAVKTNGAASRIEEITKMLGELSEKAEASK